jgi:branched-chain amino acid transport system substrate-binding protein
MRHRSSLASRWWRGPAALAALCLVSLLVSCSDSDSAANEESVRVGFLSTAKGALASPEIIAGGEAAAEYINGSDVHERSVELHTCATDGSPESSINCANEMLEARVAVVVAETDLGFDAALPVLRRADVPVFSINTAGFKASADPRTYSIGLPTSLLTGATLVALELIGSKRIAIVIPDDPARVKIFRAGFVPGASEMGMEARVLSFNPAAPDFSPIVTAAEREAIDTIAIFATEADCTNLTKTAKSLDYSGQLLVGACSKFIGTLGGDAAGATTLRFLWPVEARAFAPRPVQQELDTYVEAMERAGHQDLAEGYAEFGFAAVMNVARVMDQIEGNVEPAKVHDALKGLQDFDSFVGPELTCVKRPFEAGSSCSGEMLALTVQENGALKPLKGGFLTIVKR